MQYHECKIHEANRVPDWAQWTFWNECKYFHRYFGRFKHEDFLVLEESDLEVVNEDKSLRREIHFAPLDTPSAKIVCEVKASWVPSQPKLTGLVRSIDCTAVHADLLVTNQEVVGFVAQLFAYPAPGEYEVLGHQLILPTKEDPVYRVGNYLCARYQNPTDSGYIVLSVVLKFPEFYYQIRAIE